MRFILIYIFFTVLTHTLSFSCYPFSQFLSSIFVIFPVEHDEDEEKEIWITYWVWEKYVDDDFILLFKFINRDNDKYKQRD